MGISRFLIILIIFTVIFLFIEKDKIEATKSKEEKPTVSFFDSTMYEITNTSINQVVTSKKANMYKKREELYDATIVSKAKEGSYETNSITGNKIVKIGDDVYLNGAVNLVLSDKTNVKTEELHYNTKTKIAKNKVDFLTIRGTDTFSGNSLYLDTINEKIEAKNAKFRMRIVNE